MSMSPVLRVYVGSKQRDISDMIERLKFEHSTEKDNSLELTIKKEFADAAADDDDIVADAVINFQFGFLQGDMSQNMTMKITDVEVTYTDRVTMKVRCLDAGNSMKKNSSQTIWKGKNAGTIAREIAKAHGMVADVVVGSDLRKITEESQGGKSDFEFLTYLATQENGYIFYVDSKGLHFKKRSTDTDSSLTYTYGDGRLIEFSPKFRQSTQRPESQSAMVSTFDPLTKKEATTSDVSGVKLGKFRFNGQSEETEVPDYSGVRFKTEKIFITPSRDAKASAAASNAANSDSSLKVLEAGLRVLANPLLLSDMVITISGVARRYSGNWYIKKVTHEISTSGYTTSGDITKDGTSKAVKPGVAENKEVNKTTGPKDQDANKKIHRYDQGSEPYTGRSGRGSGGGF